MRDRMRHALVCCAGLFPFVLVGTAEAIAVAFDLQALGGTHYRYTYTVTNDGSLGAGIPVGLFDIAFDPLLYDEASLQIVTSDPPASGWSQVILASAPGIPADYDALALAGGIPVGSAVTGFAVEFAWLGGTGGPGSQSFVISNPDTFQPLEGGTTSPVTAVPEPRSVVLLSVGLLALAGWRMTHQS
jgi:hypothetical protein